MLYLGFDKFKIMANYLYRITASSSFCASLVIEKSQGDCAKPHGYTYKVSVSVDFSEVDVSGFGINYNVLQGVVDNVCSSLDYCHLNDNILLKGILPSCENIAKVILKKIKQDLNMPKNLGLRVAISTRPGCLVEVIDQ